MNKRLTSLLVIIFLLLSILPGCSEVGEQPGEEALTVETPADEPLEEPTVEEPVVDEPEELEELTVEEPETSWVPVAGRFYKGEEEYEEKKNFMINYGGNPEEAIVNVNHLLSPLEGWSGVRGEVGEPAFFYYRGSGYYIPSQPRTVPSAVARQVYETDGVIMLYGEYDDEFNHPGTKPTQEQIDRFGQYAVEWPEFVGELGPLAESRELHGGVRVILEGFEKYTHPHATDPMVAKRWTEEDRTHRWEIVLVKGDIPTLAISFLKAGDPIFGITPIDLTPERRQTILRYVSYFTSRKEARKIMQNLDEVVETINMLYAAQPKLRELGYIAPDRIDKSMVDVFRTFSGLFVSYHPSMGGIGIVISSTRQGETAASLRMRDEVELFRNIYHLD